MPQATDIQNRLVTQIEGYSLIAPEFTGKVSKGNGRNFNYSADGRGIRVYLFGGDQVIRELPGVMKHRRYDFLLITMFYDANESSAEDRKAKYDSWVRNAVESDFSLNNLAMDVAMDATQYKADPTVDGVHYVVIPITVLAMEAVGT